MASGVLMTDESPFGKASVMTGYPLDKDEKAAVEKAIESSRVASVSGKYVKSSSGIKESSRKLRRRRAK